MEIGFTSTTFRQIKNLEKIVDIAKRAGADCIEWGGDIHVKTIDDAKKAKALCEKSGLLISSYGSYYVVGSNDYEEWTRICKFASEMGAESIRVWLGKKGSAKTGTEEYKNLLSDAKRICAQAKEYGLIVSPECHKNTYNDNTDAFLNFARELDADNFRTYFQSRYLDWEYDADRLERTVSLIENVHISYSECVRMQFFGKKDKTYVSKILRKLSELDYSGRVLLEYTYFGLPSYFEKDISRLRKQVNGER